jgi:DNA-binding CsgD family transcriptional regulator
LIGRDAEMRALTTALDDAADSRGAMVFLTGDAGVGKSRLAREACAQAAAQGFRVLTGRAVDSTVPVPFRPVTEALIKLARDGVTPDAAEVADYRPALGSLVPEWCRPGDGDAELSAVILGEAVLRLLIQSSPRGAVLVLEDLQWGDPETLAIVEYLADNLAGTRVLCLATLRDTVPSAGLDAVRSAEARRTAAIVHLPRLTGQAVGHMAAACLGTEDVPRAVGTLLADCDGLPFAVEEILAAAVASGELVRDQAGWHVNDKVTTGVPASIAGSVRDRLAALDQGVVEVIVTAAVLGRQFDWTLLPGLTGATEGEVLAALQQANNVQLIEPAGPDAVMFRFRHSLTRQAIMSAMLPPDVAKRSAHAAAAIEEAKPGLPGNWCVLAAELHAAAAEPERAARLLLTAGHRALRHGALSSAATSLRDARALLTGSSPDDSALALEIDEALVQALAQAGDYGALAPLAEDLIARLNGSGGDPRREAMVRITVGYLRCEDHCAATKAHLDAARQIAERLFDVELMSRVDAAAALCAMESGRLDRAEELALRALASAEAAGLDGWAAEVAIESLEVIGRREQLRDLTVAQQAFDRAHRIATEHKLAIRRITTLHELGTIDMLRDGSTGRLSKARELAQQAGAISTASVIDLQLAHTWSLGTDLDRALAMARRCEQSARRIKASRTEAGALCVQAAIAGIRTDQHAAEQAAEHAESLMPGDAEILFAAWGWARVTAALFRDDLPGALRASVSGVSSGGELAQRLPRRAWAYYGLLHVISNSSDDDSRKALERTRAAGVAVGWIEGHLAYAEAVLQGRAGRPERASALAEKASSLLVPYAPRWNHLARRLVAPAALKDGWGKPIAWMREAAAEFESTGNDRLAAACRGILRQAGERVSRAGRGNARVPAQMRRLGITSREMDVFLLVAKGISNAEIAATLFISRKTVETHVASLIAKTGQLGRRELVAHAARIAPALGVAHGDLRAA